MFYTNLLALCQQKQITPAVVARDLGLSSGLPTFWKKGSVPKAPTLAKIADYFGVTVNDLLADPAEAPPPSKLHREEGEKIAVLASVGAGIPLEAINTFDQDDPDSWEEISKLDAARGEYFALRIRGNSMEPEIHHGDVVVVRCAEEFADGDMVIALVNGDEGVCKILKYRDDGIALTSINPEYPPMIFNREQIANKPVRVIGIVEEIRRRVKRG
jgi:repressor LexA